MKMMNASLCPIDGGIQQRGDFSDACKGFSLKRVEVVRFDEPKQVFRACKEAYERDEGVSTIIVEWGEFYNEK